MAALKPFRVEGSFKMGEKMSHFSIETLAADSHGARERVMSTLGSRHRVDRHHMRIDAIHEIAAGDVTDPAVKHQLGA